jgi:anti-sigma B factor antagonist
MARVTVERYKSCVVVEVATPSLLDPAALDALGADLYRLVDEQDARRLVLDFGKVQYISSQIAGILAQLHRKTAALEGGLLVLCNVSPLLLDFLIILKFDRLLTIKATRAKAIRHFERRMKALT